MTLKLRAGSPADAQACSKICYEAFKTILEQHRFPLDFPSAEVVQGLISWIFFRRDIYSVVAELAGRIVVAISCGKSRSLRWLDSPNRSPNHSLFHSQLNPEGICDANSRKNCEFW